MHDIMFCTTRGRDGTEEERRWEGYGMMVSRIGGGSVRTRQSRIGERRVWGGEYRMARLGMGTPCVVAMNSFHIGQGVCKVGCCRGSRKKPILTSLKALTNSPGMKVK